MISQLRVSESWNFKISVTREFLVALIFGLQHDATSFSKAQNPLAATLDLAKKENATQKDDLTTWQLDVAPM